MLLLMKICIFHFDWWYFGLWKCRHSLRKHLTLIQPTLHWICIPAFSRVNNTYRLRHCVLLYMAQCIWFNEIVNKICHFNLYQLNLVVLVQLFSYQLKINLWAFNLKLRNGHVELMLTSCWVFSAILSPSKSPNLNEPKNILHLS